MLTQNSNGTTDYMGYKLLGMTLIDQETGKAIRHDPKADQWPLLACHAVFPKEKKGAPIIYSIHVSPDGPCWRIGAPRKLG